LVLDLLHGDGLLAAPLDEECDLVVLGRDVELYLNNLNRWGLTEKFGRGIKAEFDFELLIQPHKELDVVLVLQEVEELL
jgi:hypothetical protein